MSIHNHTLSAPLLEHTMLHILSTFWHPMNWRLFSTHYQNLRVLTEITQLAETCALAGCHIMLTARYVHKQSQLQPNVTLIILPARILCQSKNSTTRRSMKVITIACTNTLSSGLVSFVVRATGVERTGSSRIFHIMQATVPIWNRAFRERKAEVLGKILLTYNPVEPSSSLVLPFLLLP